MTKEELMEVVKPAVCRQLKSPASAQFPMELVTVSGNDLQGYKVDGFVDSQNSYGAMIRNDFSAVVKITGSGVAHVTSATVAAKANVARQSDFVSRFIWISILTAIGGMILYFINSSFVDLFY